MIENIKMSERGRERGEREDPFMLVPRPADSLTPPIHLASLFLRGILHFGFLGRDPGTLAGSRESKIDT